MPELTPMSTKVSSAMETAAQEAIGSEGGIITGFIGMANYLNAEGKSCWATLSGDNQSVVITLGMTKLLQMHVEQEGACQMFHDHTEEED